MPMYKITATREVNYDFEIEADTEDEAIADLYLKTQRRVHWLSYTAIGARLNGRRILQQPCSILSHAGKILHMGHV